MRFEKKKKNNFGFSDSVEKHAPQRILHNFHFHVFYDDFKKPPETPRKCYFESFMSKFHETLHMNKNSELIWFESSVPEEFYAP